jgi:hypothetical protein
MDRLPMSDTEIVSWILSVSEFLEKVLLEELQTAFIRGDPAFYSLLIKNKEPFHNGNGSLLITVDT